jgi:hypothetical protein
VRIRALVSVPSERFDDARVMRAENCVAVFEQRGPSDTRLSRAKTIEEWRERATKKFIIHKPAYRHFSYYERSDVML